MIYLFKITLFAVFSNLITGQSQGDLFEYNPEDFEVELEHGIKYKVLQESDSCSQKAALKDMIRYHYNLFEVIGNQTKYIGTSRELSKPMGMNLVYGKYISYGKSHKFV